jgi:hypothetical protein
MVRMMEQMSSLENTDDDEPPIKERKACLACFKVLELFQQRHYALVFKSEETVKELGRLKAMNVQYWGMDPKYCQFVIKVYMESLRDVDIKNQIKVDKRKQEQKEIKKRSRSLSSVARRSTMVQSSFSDARLSGLRRNQRSQLPQKKLSKQHPS